MTESQWDTIAGIDVGLSRHHIVCVNMDTGEKKQFRIRGHNFYLQKCMKEEMTGGIVLTDKTRSDTVTALVLAVGEECGKIRKLSKIDKKKQDMKKSVVLGVSPGDIVVCPDDHPWAITRSPWRHNDFYVDEVAVSAVIEKD